VSDRSDIPSGSFLQLIKNITENQIVTDSTSEVVFCIQALLGITFFFSFDGQLEIKS